MRMLSIRQHTSIVGLLCLMVVIGRMAFDIYIPALPVIQHQLLTSEHQLQLSISLFSLGFGVSQLFYGPLSDRYGRRAVLFAGLALFVLGSCLAYYSADIQQLIFARFVSGFGVGAGVVVARAISRDLFDGKLLASVSASQTLALTFALFIAPIIGAYLMHWFTWRADFLFLIVLGSLCFFIFFIALPETHTEREKHNFYDAFKNYAALIKHKHFISNVLMASCSFAGLVIYFQLTPFIFQKQYGLTPQAYSWLSLAIAFAYIVGTFSVKRQLKRHSLNRIILNGSFAMLVSGVLIVLQVLTNLTTLSGVLVASMLYVYGLRLILPSATANCLSPFKKISGTAAALLGAVLMGMAALVSFVCSLLSMNQVFLLGVTYAVLAVICLISLSLLSPRHPAA